jgi:hypothetical protein
MVAARKPRPAHSLRRAPPPVPNGAGRATPLIVVALATRASRPPARLLDELRSQGAVVYATHGASGCLRVTTAVAPDAIYLDPRLPGRLLRQLQGHPATARASICWLAPSD